MKIEAKTPKEYMAAVLDDKKEALRKLRQIILENLPQGFEESMQYGMLAYVVPKSIYPAGYHCDTSLALPFIHLAAQKNHIALYHMGLYANQALMQWFIQNYEQKLNTKPDMGRSCIRFKKTQSIPYQLIAELATKIGVMEWIELYETALKR